jgi:uncharacterized membrane protein YkvA (DUF1232 family)
MCVSRLRDIARVVPDLAILFARLALDPRVPWRRRIGLLALAAYLASPIDVIPDFIPVVGQLDDALLVALALRGVVRAAGTGLIAEHWPGTRHGLRRILRLAGYP